MPNSTSKINDDPSDRYRFDNKKKLTKKTIFMSEQPNSQSSNLFILSISHL
jgi:hypothetical protein